MQKSVKLPADEVQARRLRADVTAAGSARPIVVDCTERFASVPSRGHRHEVLRQLEIEHEAERALQFRMRFERAERLVEVERIGIDRHLSGLLLGRRRHVVVRREWTGDALERAGLRAAVIRPSLSSGPLSARWLLPVMFRWRVIARQRFALSVPVDVEAAQDGAQPLAGS